MMHGPEPATSREARAGDLDKGTAGRKSEEDSVENVATSIGEKALQSIVHDSLDEIHLKFAVLS